MKFNDTMELLKDKNLITASGEINAYDKKDTIEKLKQIQTMQSSSKNYVTSEESKEISTVVTAAMQNPTELRMVADTVVQEIQTTLEREGVARQFLSVVELNQGSDIKIRVRDKKAKAFTATGPSEISAIRYDSKEYIYPKEFGIFGSAYSDSLTILQAPVDLLQDMYEDTLEAVLVTEDSVFKKLMDATVGIDNTLQLYTNLTPNIIGKTIHQVDRHGLPISSILLGSEIWNTIANEKTFLDHFDPISKYEILRTGKLGTLLGVDIYTDHFREGRLRFLGQNEIYVVSTPDRLGTMSTRGPVTATPIDESSKIGDKKVKGWNVEEYISMTIANSKTVAKAVKL